MGYKKELLQLNVEKFIVEDVVDFDTIHDKWEFLKFDPFNWDNHLEAQEKELISEDDSMVYSEHSSSIEKEILNVAKIFSISLGRCFKRKTLLEQLQLNSSKYESVLNSLHSVISQYDASVKEIDTEIQSNSTGYEYADRNNVFNALRGFIDKSKQNFQHGLEHFKIASTKMKTYLQAVAEETEKYHAMIANAIELTKVHLQTEIEIKNRAQEKMHSMRKEYFHSASHYNRFGSTVPKEYESSTSAEVEDSARLTTETVAAPTTNERKEAVSSI